MSPQEKEDFKTMFEYVKEVRTAIIGNEPMGVKGIVHKLKEHDEKLAEQDVVLEDYKTNKTRFQTLRWFVGVLFALGATVWGWVMWLLSQMQDHSDKVK